MPNGICVSFYLSRSKFYSILSSPCGCRRKFRNQNAYKKFLQQSHAEFQGIEFGVHDLSPLFFHPIEHQLLPDAQSPPLNELFYT